MTIQEIYNILDRVAPFATQESYDNSGLLVGAAQTEVTTVLLALDITIPVVEEAAACGAQLIISHHPVIWGGLRAIAPSHPVWHLIRHQIAAICTHTCMDLAQNGLNTAIGQRMRAHLPFAGEFLPLEQLSGGRTLGYHAALQAAWRAQSLAAALQAVFDTRALRFYDSGKPIQRLAWCSGSGGDLLATAQAVGADALVTGDVKHSVWCEAQNSGISLFDCGHFETEQPFVQHLQSILQTAAPTLRIVTSTVATQPIFQTLHPALNGE